MKEYLALCTIRREGKRIRAGERVPLPDATAQALLHRDFPAIAEIPSTGPTRASTASVLSGGTFVAAASAKDTITFIRGAGAEDLSIVEEAERARPEGPRKSVLDAIDARTKALTAPPTDDDDEESA